jgi:ketosteroid isomerase-like protein
MRNIVKATLLVLLITAAGCAGAPKDDFTTADAETIRQNLAKFVAAFNGKQIDTIIGTYADNSVFMPPNAPMLRGREPLKSFFDDIFRRGATDLKMESETVVGHGPLAYQAGTYSMMYADPSKVASVRDRGKYLLVLRRMSGTWRTEYTIWASDLPKPVPTPGN